MAEEKKVAPKPEAPKSEPMNEYYLVVVGDGAPNLIKCGDMESFKLAVQEHVLGAKDVVHAFGFVGHRIPITMPISVCMIEIAGEKIKLGEDSANYSESGKIVPLVKHDETDA